MKKKIGFALLSIATFVIAIHSASALTAYEYEGWTSGNGYGTATKVDDNVTNIKGNDAATDGMYVGPFSKASTAKLADGITEEIHVGLDLEKVADKELFEISLALRNGANEYVSEAVVMTQRVDDEFKITAGWAKDFEAVVTAKGIYTYQWQMYIKEAEGAEKTYVKFTLLQGKREIATTGEVDLDTITTSDTKNPVAEEENVSVKYLWFCNVNVAEGVNVYTELPTVKLTFIDPTIEEDEEDLIVEVYQYAAFTAEEAKAFEDAVKEEAEKEGYTFNGFYADEDGTTKFDLTKPFEKDSTVYVKVTENIPEDTENDNKDETNTEKNEESKTEESEELPPKTGDLNLVLLIGILVLGVVGTVIVSKKRLVKNN